MIQDIDPYALLNHPDWFVVDVRPADERFGDIGFIAGSLWCPYDSDVFETTIAKLAESQTCVLNCLGGHRSQKIQQDFGTTPQPILNLKGGLLAWKSARLPFLIWPSQPNNQVPEDMFQRVRACFVAQLTETMLDEASDQFINPVQLIEDCMKPLGLEHGQTSSYQWIALLDHLAHLSKSQGTDLDVIEKNYYSFMNLFIS